MKKQKRRRLERGCRGRLSRLPSPAQRPAPPGPRPRRPAAPATRVPDPACSPIPRRPGWRRRQARGTPLSLSLSDRPISHHSLLSLPSAAPPASSRTLTAPPTEAVRRGPCAPWAAGRVACAAASPARARRLLRPPRPWPRRPPRSRLYPSPPPPRTRRPRRLLPPLPHRASSIRPPSWRP